MTKVPDNLSAADRYLVAAAKDKAMQAMRQNSPSFTGFLDPGQRALLKQYRYLWEEEMTSFGGYQGAERQVVAFARPGFEVADHDFPLAAIQAQGRQEFGKLTHRDYLGSLLALGIKRDTVGDILVNPDGCQVFVLEQLASYVLANWTAVGRIGIKTAQIPLAEIDVPEQKVAWRQATVASLRLDAALAVAYGLSRSKAADFIRAGKVKHNHITEIHPDREVAPGDVLSLAGQGRAEIHEIGGQSKKGRLFIRIARLL